MEKNYIRLPGKLIDLCTYRTDDEAIDKYNTWFNDSTINMWIKRNGMVTYITKDNIKRMEDWFGSNEYAFNIQLKNGELVGICNIEVQPTARNSMLSIYIGEESARDKGIGTEVIKMLVKYCFEELNLHNVVLKVKADNARAIKVYEKCGFKICGTEKDKAFYQGHWCDVHTMQILEQEYFDNEQWKIQ